MFLPASSAHKRTIAGFHRWTDVFISTKLTNPLKGSNQSIITPTNAPPCPKTPLFLLLSSPPFIPRPCNYFSDVKEELKKKKKPQNTSMPQLAWNHRRFVSAAANWCVSAPRSDSCGRESRIESAFSKLNSVMNDWVKLCSLSWTQTCLWRTFPRTCAVTFAKCTKKRKHLEGWLL